MRPYDYRGLAFGVDYLYVMAYSIQSQIFARCVACGNTYTQTAYGLQQFGALGIPMDRLVLGTSWGGNAWPCRNFDGGFGSVPGAESHAGQVFTCVGAFRPERAGSTPEFTITDHR